MPKFNTGNPVGSADPRDLYDTAEVADKLVHGNSEVYADRRGKSRKSWAGIEQDFQNFLQASGYEFLGNYAAGIEVTASNQVIREAGEFWRAAAATALPYTTTGAGMPEGGAFKSVGDAVLRQDLGGNLSNGLGANVVNGAALYAGTIAELEALPLTEGQTVRLTETGKSGTFVFDSSNLSTEVTGDPGQLEYVAPASDPTGASGASVRQPVLSPLKGGLKSFRDFAEQFSFSGGNEDLLERVKSMAANRGMYFRVIDSSSVGVGFGMSIDEAAPGNKYVVEYRFLFDGDNLLLFRGGYSGVEDQQKIFAAATLAGTFVTTSVNSYTTTPGDDFTATFTGSRMIFRTYKDNRGGVWKVTLSDGQQKFVSTYSATAGDFDVPVFDNLLHQTYQVAFEFQGDDPINPPSGGTSRGWLKYGTDAGDPGDQPIKFGLVAPIDSATEQAISASGTINDFAIRARPSGAIYDREWVPQHGAVSGVASSPSFRLQVDGETVADSAGTLPSASGEFSYYECKTFNILQQFNATNPNGADGIMWVHNVNHSINSESMTLKIANRIDVSQGIDVDSAYFGMLGINSNNISRLVLNDRTERDTIPQDDSSEAFGWGVTSGFWAGEYSAGRYHGAAVRVSSLREAASLGVADLQQDLPVLVTYRADGVAKLYWLWAGPDATTGILAPGDVYACQHDICLVSGVRFPNTLLKPA